MTTPFRIAASAVFVILSFFPALGQPLPSATSAQGFHSKVRLLSGGKQGENWLAGIEITLDPGFKTYWRSPGESGLPPSFDWSRSENVANIEVRWPAPMRYEDAAGIAYVYTHKVVLPTVVSPIAKDKPVKLALFIDYGICKDICIPAHAELNLPLSETGLDHAAIENAMSMVPRQQAVGERTDLSILSVQPPSPAGNTLVVTAHAPTGSPPVLFAEGPDNWYFSVSKAVPETSAATTAWVFNLTIEEKPKEAAGPIPLTLTLVAGGKATETQVSLDGNGLPR